MASKEHNYTFVLKLEDGRTKEEAGDEIFHTIIVDGFIRAAMRSQSPECECLKNVRYNPPWGNSAG